MMQRRRLRTTILIFILVSVLACAYTKTFTLSEHVGIWRADYMGVQCFDIKLTGVETLTLRANGTYQQVYDDGKGYVYRSPWNRWHLKSKEGILYLESGRMYSLGIEEAEQRANARGALCTYLPYSSMDDNITIDCADAILYILPEPGAKGGVVLLYPQVCDPDASKYVKFYLVATLGPAVTIAP